MLKKIKLVAETYSSDAVGQRISRKEERRIVADIHSVSLSEITGASQIGASASIQATVHKSEYHGEQIAIVNDQQYHIYRTYDANNGRMELYLEEMTGK